MLALFTIIGVWSRESRVNGFEVHCRGGSHSLQVCLIRWPLPTLYPCHTPGKLVSEMEEQLHGGGLEKGICPAYLIVPFLSQVVVYLLFVLFSGKGLSQSHILTHPQRPRPQVLTGLMSPTALFSWGL